MFSPVANTVPGWKVPSPLPRKISPSASILAEDDDVVDAVAGEVADDHRAGAVGEDGRVGHRGQEGPVAPADQDGELRGPVPLGEVLEDGHIGVVAPRDEVAGDQGVGAGHGVVGALGLEAAVAVAQQDRDVPRAEVGDGDVEASRRR